MARADLLMNITVVPIIEHESSHIKAKSQAPDLIKNRHGEVAPQHDALARRLPA